MGSSSSAKRGPFWRAEWVLALLVLAAVLVLARATDAVHTVERRFYDFGSTSGNRQSSDRIAVIPIAVTAGPALGALRAGPEGNLQQTVIRPAVPAGATVSGYDAPEKADPGTQERFASTNPIRTTPGPVKPAGQEQQRDVPTPPGKI